MKWQKRTLSSRINSKIIHTKIRGLIVILIEKRWRLMLYRKYSMTFTKK